jgi:hypothetical protein
MLSTRLSFTLSPADADAVQRIAEDYRIPLARIVRDAVRMLLDQEPQYRAALLACLGYAVPTPEQMAASQQLIAEARQIDMSELIAACTPPSEALHERCERVWHI